MKWEFKNDRPIYTQLIEKIELSIVSGQFPAGSKLPSVRDLATESGVNPNTMQKALSELERDGLVYSQRTAGRFITEDTQMIQKTRRNLAIEQIEQFFQQMGLLGFTREEALEIVKKAIEEEK